MKLTKQSPILCIDPGEKESGAVIFDGLNILWAHSTIDNIQLLSRLSNDGAFGTTDPIFPAHLVIEGISSYGMAVGKSTFETVEWIGRFREAFDFDDTTKIYRRDIKMFLCQSMRAKDSNIRQRILDIFPGTGGGKTPQIGTKKQPGPLYRVTSHAMSALAIGLTYYYGQIDEVSCTW